MRNAFADEVTKLAEQDERIVLLAGDIGNRLFDTYQERCPDRFFNCGVAEANMTGVAGGLGLCGMRPITYTIAPFVTTRCLEQIRVDLCYHEVPAIVAAVGAGLSYASLGATHHSCEDIAFLRALPGMSVVCPADSHEVRGALRAALAQDGPVYLRLGKKGEPEIHDEVPADFEIGRAITIRPGSEICMLSTGNTMPLTLDAAARLEDRGVSTRVVSFHTVKPLDERLLAEAFASYAVVVTIEEHSLIGGFGSAVAEWVADRSSGAARLLRIGTADRFIHEAGNQAHARSWHGLTAESIAERALAAYGSVDSRSTLVSPGS
jgi:transketolase